MLHFWKIWGKIENELHLFLTFGHSDQVSVDLNTICLCHCPLMSFRLKKLRKTNGDTCSPLQMMPKSFLISREEETEEKIMPSKSDTHLSLSKCDIFWRKNVFQSSPTENSSCNAAWPNHWEESCHQSSFFWGQKVANSSCQVVIDFKSILSVLATLPTLGRMNLCQVT